jgi:hypothetical protein
MLVILGVIGISNESIYFLYTSIKFRFEKHKRTASIKNIYVHNYIKELISIILNKLNFILVNYKTTLTSPSKETLDKL